MDHSKPLICRMCGKSMQLLGVAPRAEAKVNLIYRCDTCDRYSKQAVAK